MAVRLWVFRSWFRDTYMQADCPALELFYDHDAYEYASIIYCAFFRFFFFIATSLETSYRHRI